jgi:hypothetical protein
MILFLMIGAGYNTGAIVGGIVGGVALLLLLLAVVVVVVYLFRKKKTNKYKEMSAIGMYTLTILTAHQKFYYGMTLLFLVYSVNGDGDGYDNPTYEADVHIRGMYSLHFKIQSQSEHHTFTKNTIPEPSRRRQSNRNPPGDQTYSLLGNSQTTPCNA